MKNRLLGFLFILIFALGCLFLMNAEGAEVRNLEDLLAITWEKSFGFNMGE